MRTLRRLHANQNGAVAFMVLCAIMIALMMGLVVYDSIPAARQKMEVQTAADTAVWSQSAVDARTMNMLAFSNVSKRVLLGQTLYYKVLWDAWFILLAIMIAILIIMVVLCFFGVGCAFLDKVIATLATMAQIMIAEAPDAGRFGYLSHSGGIFDRLEEDLKALDTYQKHFVALNPWWGWGESWRRGLRNGALVSGWPVPDNLMGEVAGLIDIPQITEILSTQIEDNLPVEKYENYNEACKESLVPDAPIYFVESLLLTLACNDCNPSGGGGLPSQALHAITNAIAIGLYFLDCSVGGTHLNSHFSTDYAPYQLKELSGAEWYLNTSNMVFAYRPGEDFSGVRRDKYAYMSKDYVTNLDFLYDADGFFGLARSEFAYQDGDPNLWHAQWGARMRPVALPGEWEAYSGDWRMAGAFNDTVPYLAGSAVLFAAIQALAGTNGTFGMGTKMGEIDVTFSDLFRAEVAFESMIDSRMDGIAR